MSSILTARVSALNIFPVKSCAGIALQQARLSPTGLQHDRRWMLVKPDGYFLTQRELPRMALIKPELQNDGMILTAPGMQLIDVSGLDESRPCEVAIWRDLCAAFDEGDGVAEWLSTFLHQSVRLVRFNDQRARLSNIEWTGDLQAPNHFTDGFPILVISAASVADLNARLQIPLAMNRFRPNIVIEGVDAYTEDRVDEMRGQAFCLKLVKPCTRCKITTTNQETGIVEGDEPLLTLVQYRRNLQLKGVVFGQNAILVSGTGATVSVGESVTLSLHAIRQ